MFGIVRKVRVATRVLSVVIRVCRYIWVITFGVPRPKRDDRRPPHEYLDLLRPEVSIIGKIVQGFMFIGIIGLILRVQSFVVPAGTGPLQSFFNGLTDPWWAGLIAAPFMLFSWMFFVIQWFPWEVRLLLIPLAVIFYHRGVFRAVLIFANEPYDDGKSFYPEQLRRGVSTFWVDRIMFGALGLTILLDLLRSNLAYVSLLISLACALVAGIRLARWYIGDVKERYELLKEFQIEKISELPDTVHGLPKLLVKLPRGFVAGNLPALQEFAVSRGCTVTSYDLTLMSRSATLTPVNEAEYSVYKIAEDNLKRPIYEFEIDFEWASDDRSDKAQFPERLETYRFLRSPVVGIVPEKRQGFYEAIMVAIPGWTNGCWIEDTNDNPVKTFHWAPPLVLPDIFLTQSVLPKSYPSMLEILQKRIWARPVQGISPRGRLVSVNLARVPHMLNAGGTNSGKSSTVLHDMVYRRACGHSLALFDNSSKKGGTFLNVKEHTFMFCTSPTESANGLAMLKAEVTRRSRFLMENYRINDWLLTDDFEGLIAAGIVPMTVYYDEYETSITQDKEPKNLDPDDPKRVATQNRNRAIDEIEGYVLALAREARAVGVFLYIATQKPLVAKIGSSLRDQLGNSLQLAAGKMTSGNVALTMGSEADVAMEEFKLFNRPKLDNDGFEMRDDSDQVIMMPGLGVLLADGSEPTALRMAYLKPEDAPTMLKQLGVPEAEPWEITDSLDLGMAEDATRFIDRRDTRPRIQPPFPASGVAITTVQSGTGSLAAVMEEPVSKSFKLSEMYPKS